MALSDAVTGPVDITCGIMDTRQKRFIVSGSGIFSKGEVLIRTGEKHDFVFNIVMYAVHSDCHKVLTLEIHCKFHLFMTFFTGLPGELTLQVFG